MEQHIASVDRQGQEKKAQNDLDNMSQGQPGRIPVCYLASWATFLVLWTGKRPKI